MPMTDTNVHAELTIGEEIGRGGFCVVHDLTRISPCAVVEGKTEKHTGSGFLKNISKSDR